MNVRIKKIDVQSAGILSSFKKEISPLTLIYGKNETGKTTLVENILASLFKRKLKRNENGFVPQLRGEELIGNAKIMVDGIDEKSVSFSPDNETIDDFINSNNKLPAGLYNLLFVKGSETAIIDERGGITRSELKNLLSQQKALSDVMGKLPGELDKTLVDNKKISGDNRGRYFKQYSDSMKSLERLEHLEDKFNSSLSKSNITGLKNKLKEFKKQREAIFKAKQYSAYLVSCEIEKKSNILSKLSQEKIEKTRSDIQNYLQYVERMENLTSELKEFSNLEEDIKWLENAKDIFQHNIPAPSAILSKILVALSVLPAAVAAVIYFLKPLLIRAEIMLICGIVSILFFIIYLIHSIVSSKKNNEEISSEEIKQLKKSYENKYNSKLNSTNDLITKKKLFDEKLVIKKRVMNEKSDFESKKSILASSIEMDLKGYKRLIPISEGEEHWQDSILKVMEVRSDLHEKYTRLKAELKTMEIDSSDYIKEDPGVKYSSKRIDEIDAEIDDINFNITKENEKTAGLREELGGEMGESLRTFTIEEISEKIQKKIQDVKNSINKNLSILIAGLTVKNVLMEFISDEDKQMEQYINEPSIIELIKKFTGHYDRVELRGEEIFVCNSNGSFPLRNLSTGAQEQVLLAFRLGMAKKITGKDSLFLILDDAFQYSDWERRQYMVSSTVDLIKNGWQAIYFTMDDDIRDRFVKEGKSLSEGMFSYYEL